MVMMFRSLLLAAATLLASATTALAQPNDDAIAIPILRASVTVTADVVRIGDMIDNAGAAGQIAIYRAPDPGTTGSLPTAQVLSVLRAHDVIGVDTRDIKEVSVTRLARTIEARGIELAVAQALEHRGGLGEAANISLTFDREIADVRLDASNTGALMATAARYEPRNRRFDVTFEISNESGLSPARLRFTGTAIETVEVAVLTRDVERTDLLKSSDLQVERRPKADVGNDAASPDRAVGMQMRRPLRAGQPLHLADLTKPDLVQRDQGVTVIYQTAGLYLTVRGKALDSGTEGDVVNVLNLLSKRTISGVVTDRGQVTIQVATPKPIYVSDTGAVPAPAETAAPGPVAVEGSQQPSRPE
jgi:flagellar basal body P-ring formation protein FlgA